MMKTNKVLTAAMSAALLAMIGNTASAAWFRASEKMAYYFMGVQGCATDPKSPDYCKECEEARLKAGKPKVGEENLTDIQKNLQEQEWVAAALPIRIKRTSEFREHLANMQKKLKGGDLNEKIESDEDLRWDARAAQDAVINLASFMKSGKYAELKKSRVRAAKDYPASKREPQKGDIDKEYKAYEDAEKSFKEMANEVQSHYPLLGSAALQKWVDKAYDMASKKVEQPAVLTAEDKAKLFTPESIKEFRKAYAEAIDETLPKIDERLNAYKKLRDHGQAVSELQTLLADANRAGAEGNKKALNWLLEQDKAQDWNDKINNTDVLADLVYSVDPGNPDLRDAGCRLKSKVDAARTAGKFESVGFNLALVGAGFLAGPETAAAALVRTGAVRAGSATAARLATPAGRLALAAGTQVPFAASDLAFYNQTSEECARILTSAANGESKLAGEDNKGIGLAYKECVSSLEFQKWAAIAGNAGGAGVMGAMMRKDVAKAFGPTVKALKAQAADAIENAKIMASFAKNRIFSLVTKPEEREELVQAGKDLKTRLRAKKGMTEARVDQEADEQIAKASKACDPKNGG